MTRIKLPDLGAIGIEILVLSQTQALFLGKFPDTGEGFADAWFYFNPETGTQEKAK